MPASPRTLLSAPLAFALVVVSLPLAAARPQAKPGPSAAGAHAPARIAEHREALDRLAMLDGEWRGPAHVITPDGTRIGMVQTERVGPMLDGTIRMIEGRGHAPDGRVVFNALGIVSYDPKTQSYTMRSYTGGHAGDFPLRATGDGFEWEIPSGPATMRYRATVRDGRRVQTGELIREGQPPLEMFGMQLERIGDSAWPAGGAVGPK